MISKLTEDNEKYKSVIAEKDMQLKECQEKYVFLYVRTHVCIYVYVTSSAKINHVSANDT